MTRFAVFDVETSGLRGPDESSSGVAEVGCLEFNPQTFEVIDHWVEFTNPGRPMEPGASAINGITDDMVVDKPTLAEVMAKRWDTSPTVVIAHNAQFDLRYLGGYIENLRDSLCSLALARQHIRETTNHKLGTLVSELGLEAGEAHSALGDTLGCFNLLRRIIEVSGRSLDDLIALSRKPLVMHNIPFGRYKGWSWHNVPVSYLEWMLSQDFPPDMHYTARQSLKGRL